jgi:hypothetical protein
MAPIIISDISEKENLRVVGSEQIQTGIFWLCNYNYNYLITIFKKYICI